MKDDNKDGGRSLSAITRRDYFAAQALPGLHAEYLNMVSHGEHLGRGDYENMATDAYCIADAMLKAREA